jgi:hypothetical protein
MVRPVGRRGLLSWLLGGSWQPFEVVLLDHGLYLDLPDSVREKYCALWWAAGGRAATCAALAGWLRGGCALWAAGLRASSCRSQRQPCAWDARAPPCGRSCVGPLAACPHRPAAPSRRRPAAAVPRRLAGARCSWGTTRRRQQLQRRWAAAAPGRSCLCCSRTRGATGQRRRRRARRRVGGCGGGAQAGVGVGAAQLLGLLLPPLARRPAPARPPLHHHHRRRPCRPGLPGRHHQPAGHGPTGRGRGAAHHHSGGCLGRGWSLQPRAVPLALRRPQVPPAALQPASPLASPRAPRPLSPCPCADLDPCGPALRRAVPPGTRCAT